MAEISVGIYAPLGEQALEAVVAIQVGILLQIIGSELVYHDAYYCLWGAVVGCCHLCRGQCAEHQQSNGMCVYVALLDWLASAEQV